MKVTYHTKKIKLINDNNLFFELKKEGYKENQVVNASQQVINGIETESFYFENCVAYLGTTCEII